MDENDHSEPHGCFFDERFTHPDASALDAPKGIEFDWEALRSLMGEANDSMSPADHELMSMVLRRLLAWAVRGNRLDLIGRRVVALAWVTNPDIFDKDSSASTLARKMGIHKALLSEDVADFSRKFGVRNRQQSHGWNFKEKSNHEKENGQNVGGKPADVNPPHEANQKPSGKRRRPDQGGHK